MLLCGHEHGQALRVDRNDAGHVVYQILADYQDRGQSGIDAGQPRDKYFGGPVGIGDGWLRLMKFELMSERPSISVRTYSTFYGRFSSEVEDYAAWYRDHEQPDMSDAEFQLADEFKLELRDFRARFGLPGQRLPSRELAATH